MIVKRATIKDVANQANVSIKTVSRVVRQEPNVKKTTREKVDKAISDLNYRPMASVRSSVGGRSFMLGLLFDNPNPSYTSDLIRGALLESRNQGYHLAVEPIDTSEDNLEEVISKFVIQSNVDGIVLPPPLSDHTEILTILNALGIPVALLAPSSQKRTTSMVISMDDRKAAYEMTNHLIELGHEDIAFVAGRAGTATTLRRISGFNAAMFDAELQINPDWIIHAGYEFLPARDAGTYLLSQARRPTAIFAANDDMAAGILTAGYKLGLSIPADVSVAGFDDSVIATSVWPPLTTIRQPIQEMAALAISKLVGEIRNLTDNKVTNSLVSSSLVIRESTGAVPQSVTTA